MEGVLNLYKPAGPSSARYVYKLRPLLRERRVGHAGALDPFAEGVLLACAGGATRLVERLMHLPKTYEATLVLGVTNETYDTERPFEPVAGAADPGRAEIERVAAEMIGEIEQAPPLFSAVRLGGRRSYEHGREGTLELGLPGARRVRIDSIEVTKYRWPEVELVIRCGRGTYIRAMARDIGAALGCGACCRRLVRTAVGPFFAAEAIDLRSASVEEIYAAVRAADEVLSILDGET
jgi:tRNA pseudouridine55 synthase